MQSNNLPKLYTCKPKILEFYNSLKIHKYKAK